MSRYEQVACVAQIILLLYDFGEMKRVDNTFTFIIISGYRINDASRFGPNV